MAKYIATHIGDDRYLVEKRRWFGLLSSVYRIAIWDGCYFHRSNNSRPDWHWETNGGRPSEEMVRFRARKALIREWKRHRGMLPNEWNAFLTPARLLEGK